MKLQIGLNLRSGNSTKRRTYRPCPQESPPPIRNPLRVFFRLQATIVTNSFIKLQFRTFEQPPTTSARERARAPSCSGSVCLSAALQDDKNAGRLAGCRSWHKEVRRARRCNLISCSQTESALRPDCLFYIFNTGCQIFRNR